MQLLKETQYPPTIEVNNEEYRIIFCKRILQRDSDKHSHILGACDSDKKVIKLKKGLRDYELFKTFMHELLHAIEFEYGLKISHKLIHKLEVPLSNLFIQNF